MNNWNLEKKKAFVTGGSKGIGKAIVKELSALGAEVLFSARNEEETVATAQEFLASGTQVHYIIGNLTDKHHRGRIADWISSRWGKLDILVNNAGINIRKPSNAYLDEELSNIIDTDLLAPFQLCSGLYPFLEKSGKASIINIASVAGSYDVLNSGAPYGMAKSGLIQLSRNLAAEWAGANIRVNTVSPWFTYTPLTRAVFSDEEKLRRITSRTPAKRIARDDEVAAAVAFLAMDKASYITGHNLVVDGGVTTGLL